MQGMSKFRTLFWAKRKEFKALLWMKHNEWKYRFHLFEARHYKYKKTHSNWVGFRIQINWFEKLVFLFVYNLVCLDPRYEKNGKALLSHFLRHVTRT